MKSGVQLFAANLFYDHSNHAAVGELDRSFLGVFAGAFFFEFYVDVSAVDEFYSYFAFGYGVLFPV